MVNQAICCIVSSLSTNGDGWRGSLGALQREAGRTRKAGQRYNFHPVRPFLLGGSVAEGKERKGWERPE
jgi:hypothetical protein